MVSAVARLEYAVLQDPAVLTPTHRHVFMTVQMTFLNALRKSAIVTTAALTRALSHAVMEGVLAVPKDSDAWQAFPPNVLS